MFIKINNEDKVTRGEGSQYSIDNYLTKENSKNISVAVSHLCGQINNTRNVESDRIYYFMSAEAEFNVDGKIVKVKDGDVIFISKNTLYSVVGNFDAVLINTPAFDIKNEQTESVIWQEHLEHVIMFT